MYNFAMAFILCCLVYLIGDWVSMLTRAWVPSVFVTAVVCLLGFWTGLVPTDIVSKSALIPFGSSIGIFLLLVHMGTIISLKQLAEQWKTIVICVMGLVGMCLFSWFLAKPIIGRDYVIAGLPPLTGGIVAATTMRDAAEAAGLKSAALFAIAMYCVQGFAGYPLTAICLQFEGRKLLKDFRANGGKADTSAIDEANKLEAGAAAKTGKKKLIPAIPEKWNGPVMIFIRMGIVAWLATQMGTVKIPGTGFAISGAVWALLFGVLATTIGFLDVNSLNKANSYGIIMFALMMYIFDGLKDASPAPRPQGRPQKLKFSFKEQREFDTIDEDIAALEERLVACEAEIAANASDYVRLQALSGEKEELERQLEEKTERWVYLNDLAERIAAQKP